MTRTLNGIPETELKPNRFLPGHLYKISVNNQMNLYVFSKPDLLHGIILAPLENGEIFMVIRKLHPWLHIGVKDLFGYVWLPLNTLFENLIEEGRNGAD